MNIGASRINKSSRFGNDIRQAHSYNWRLIENRMRRAGFQSVPILMTLSHLERSQRRQSNNKCDWLVEIMPDGEVTADLSQLGKCKKCKWLAATYLAQTWLAAAACPACKCCATNAVHRCLVPFLSVMSLEFLMQLSPKMYSSILVSKLAFSPNDVTDFDQPDWACGV